MRRRRAVSPAPAVGPFKSSHQSTPPTAGALARAGKSTLSASPEHLASGRSGPLLWLSFVGLVSAGLCLPFVRAIYWLGDEGELLHGAERMLHGARIYADFFEFLPPGGFVLTEAWLWIAGSSILSARSLAILTIVGIACFTFLACHQASRRPLLSALLTIGWVMMSQGVWTEVSHQWFTTLFSMIVAWLAIAKVEHPRRGRWPPFIAGTVAGAAAMVTPTRGALAMLAALAAFFDLRRDRVALVLYIAGSILVPACLIAYLVRQHAFVPAFDDVILWTAERYASVQGVPFGYSAGLQNFLLGYLFQATALLMLVICIRDRRVCLRNRLLWTCFAFGVAGFVGCYPRPDIVHIAFAAPLTLPLLAYCMTRLTQRWYRAYRYVAVGVMIAIAVPSACSFSWSAERAWQTKLVPTPRGGVAVIGLPGFRALLARIAATPSGDAYFFYPYMPLLPFLTARRDVSRYDMFIPEYTTPYQYQKACISVMRSARWVVIDRDMINPGVLKQMFPSMRDPRPSEMRKFERAVDGAFRLVARDGRFDLRRRRAHGVSPQLCANIAK